MTGRSRMTWDDRALYNRLRTFNARADRFLTAATAYHATQAVAYARQNARWTDRTGNARNGLFARAERDAPAYRIIIGHSVPYGVWLEVRWSGRYQIIRPTVDHEGPELMKTVATMYSTMFRG
jgi:hypothetical protein